MKAHLCKYISNFCMECEQILVEMVRLAQKHGMKGIKGDWKEFLDFHDKKLGASLSDPTRRSIDLLSAFLKTFTKEDDLKVIGQLWRFAFGIYCLCFRLLVLWFNNHKAIRL